LKSWRITWQKKIQKIKISHKSDLMSLEHSEFSTLNFWILMLSLEKINFTIY
jgi:hypothetical protein